MSAEQDLALVCEVPEKRAPGQAGAGRDLFDRGLVITVLGEEFECGPLESLAGGVRSSVVRLSPLTHSPELDRHGFATVLIATARRTGVSAYIGDGANRWSAAHTKDTARLFRRALEKAPAGARLHAVGDEAVAIKEIASAIGERLGLPSVSIRREDAADHFGFLGELIQLDAPASNTITQQLLGWQPTQPGLIADLHDDRYYSR